MTTRYSLIVAAIAIAVLPSCAVRYQELLTDRDSEIRELKSTIADMRAGREDLPPQPASVAADESELALLRHAVGTPGDGPTVAAQADLLGGAHGAGSFVSLRV